MRLAIPNRIRPLRILLVIALLEIFLGGGGRLIDTGVLTIRMWLFAIALVFGVVFILTRGLLHAALANLTVMFTGLLVAGVVIGLITGHDISSILIDVKPLLFFYYVLFFAALIRTEKDVELVIKLLKISGLILAIGYLIIFALINTNSIDFRAFYTWASYTEEFYFRGEFAFFYKGFLFLCAGVCFFSWRDGFKSKVAIALILTAALFTFTRGFVLSLFALYLLKLSLVEKRWRMLGIVLAFSIISAGTVWAYISNSDELGKSRAESNLTRVTQLLEVGKELNPITLFTGRGFGLIETPTRITQHIEIAYAEILLKQGIIGLAFWAYLAYVIFTYYNMAVRNGNGERAKAFLLASLFTFIISFFNPYINNPMGITLLMMSLICLSILAQPATEDVS